MHNKANVHLYGTKWSDHNRLNRLETQKKKGVRIFSYLPSAACAEGHGTTTNSIVQHFGCCAKDVGSQIANWDANGGGGATSPPTGSRRAMVVAFRKSVTPDQLRVVIEN